MTFNVKTDYPATLPSSFERYRKIYTLIEHDGHRAIYRCQGREQTNFEVWNLRRTEDGKILPPRSSEWGKHGWTLLTEKRAREKYAELSRTSLTETSQAPPEGNHPKDNP